MSKLSTIGLLGLAAQDVLALRPAGCSDQSPKSSTAVAAKEQGIPALSPKIDITMLAAGTLAAGFGAWAGFWHAPGIEKKVHQQYYANYEVADALNKDPEANGTFKSSDATELDTKITSLKSGTTFAADVKTYVTALKAAKKTGTHSGVDADKKNAKEEKHYKENEFMQKAIKASSYAMWWWIGVIVLVLGLLVCIAGGIFGYSYKKQHPAEQSLPLK